MLIIMPLCHVTRAIMPCDAAVVDYAIMLMMPCCCRLFCGEATRLLIARHIRHQYTMAFATMLALMLLPLLCRHDA